jgi:hypothetical protein
MSKTREVLKLSAENGRSATAHAWGDKVVITFWRKNQSPLLPLILTRDESAKLRELLQQAEAATLSA